MSNLQSILGGAVWMVIAAALMLCALDPAPSGLSDTQFAAVKVASGFADI